MQQPLIGITTHASNAPDCGTLDHFLAHIVRAIAKAGGCPVIIPAGLTTDTLQGIFERLDGLLLSGGGDIDPAHYNTLPTAVVGGVDPARDTSEIDLVRWTVAAAKPVLGICRGLQVLNVALGGTLYRDISEHPNPIAHTYYPGHPFDLLPHPVTIAPTSRLAQIVGQTELPVNSLHHQAVASVAPGLQVVACAPDGLVEALEASEHPFALAVQWHPEILPEQPEMQAMFRALVLAALQQPVLGRP